jgi:uncharacterized protein (DUF305 family)
MKSPKFSVAALIIAISSTYAVASPQATPHGATPMAHDMPEMQMDKAHMDAMQKSSSSNVTEASTELQFLDTMSMHHKMAIDMAKLAATRAKHTELKSLASKMIADQQKESGQMKIWRKQWYASKPEAVNMQMAGMQNSMDGMDMDKLAALRGEQFDLMFIDMMTKHHEGAIKMSQAAEPDLQHAQVKAFAKKIITSQKEEIARMKRWKKSWTEAKR